MENISNQQKREKALINLSGLTPENGDPITNSKLVDMQFTYDGTMKRLLKNESITILEPDRFAFIGRDKELLSMRESFRKRRMKSMVLVGNAGCGKTALAKAFAKAEEERIVILNLDIMSLVSNTRYVGDFEAKLENILEPLKKLTSLWKRSGGLLKEPVMFIDEIHMIVGADRSTGNANDLSNYLKSWLSEGEITIIGATTPVEYKTFIAPDSALMRRLTPICLVDLKNEEVVAILKAFAEEKIEDLLLQKIVDVTSKMPYSHNPDCAIELLDRLEAYRELTGKTIDEESIKSESDYMRSSLEMINDAKTLSTYDGSKASL